MSDAELDAIEEQARRGHLTGKQTWDLITEVRRLRKICADALPFAETALRAGLDFGPEVQDELVNSHAMIVALRSAGR